MDSAYIDKTKTIALAVKIRGYLDTQISAKSSPESEAPNKPSNDLSIVVESNKSLPLERSL